MCSILRPDTFTNDPAGSKGVEERLANRGATTHEERSTEVVLVIRIDGQAPSILIG